jgi:hypothetical protein
VDDEPVLAKHSDRNDLPILKDRRQARGCRRLLGSAQRVALYPFEEGGNGESGLLSLANPESHHNAAMARTGNVGAGGYCGDAGDAGAAPSRLRRPRDSERAVAGRRGGSATPAHCGWFAMAKSNVARFEYQYGGGTSRRKSSSAAFIAAMVCAA